MIQKNQLALLLNYNTYSGLKVTPFLLNITNIVIFLYFFKIILIYLNFSLVYLNKFIAYFLFEITNFSFLISIILLCLGFLKIIFIENFKLFEIKKYSIFFCINLMSFFFFNFFSISKLYYSYYLIYSFSWYGTFLNIEYLLGLDPLSFIFIILTLFLIPICLVISWKNIYYNTKYFFIIFIILEILLINVFCAIDILLFYIAFESILIPMYFLVGYWGSRERRMHAAFQFFLYTLGGSLFLLFALIFCQLNYGSTNLFLLINLSFSPYRELILWVCFFFAFAVKIPLMPVHIWLPEAHVESATGGSVALAGILLKLGTYGVLRFLMPLFPFGSIFFTPFIYLISVLGVFFSSLTTLRQIDLKKIIAYSSIIHMNYLMFGLFSFNIEGLLGSIILMIAHGFVSGGLFVCVGILYDRYHTRLQKPYGGLNYFMPVFSLFFLIFTLANISFPGSINFIGEFFVLLGIFFKNILIGIFLMFLMIFSTCYALWLYNKIFSGLIILNKYNLKIFLNGFLFKKLKFFRFFLVNYTDLNIREFFSLVYLLVPVFYFGFKPLYLMDIIELQFLIFLTLQN